TPMSEIAILVSSLPAIAKRGVSFVFTDRHAYLAAAQFSSQQKDLDWIDWKIIKAQISKRDTNDPGKIERYQAEALVHRELPASALLDIACYEDAQAARIRAE